MIVPFDLEQNIKNLALGIQHAYNTKRPAILR